MDLDRPVAPHPYDLLAAAPSARLCERLGMQQDAHLRQDWWSRGEWTDTAVYGVLVQEWPPGSP